MARSDTQRETFGDAVTLRVWPDMWLHEGFATFSEWLWREHTGQKSQNKYGTIDTPGFVALASKESGQDLGRFFDVWLYQPGKPTSW